MTVTTSAEPLWGLHFGGVQAAGRRDLRLSLAVLTCATRILRALRPGLAASLVIFSLPAAFWAYQIAANPVPLENMIR